MVARTIALVFPACSRDGGVERCVREVARRLATRYRVTFVGDEFDANGMAGVTFHRLGGPRLKGPFAPLSFRLRAARALRHGYDVTISWGVECPPGDILAVASVHRAWLRRGRPIPTRVGAIPNWVRYLMPQHFTRLALERQYYRSSKPAKLSVLSEQTAGELIELYDVPRGRMVIIANGYSADEFSAQRSIRERAARRHELGIGDDQILILLVANELHRKGFATLLDAVALVDDDRLIISVVGRAPIGAYRSQIDRLGLADRVRWHGPSNDVAGWYAAADLFVMPSHYEAYPLVVIEALASGLPVITTAFAGSLDAVQPGVNGLLLSDPDDATELAKLLRAGTDPTVRGRWRAAAAPSVARLNWAVIGERYVQLIEQIAG